MDNNPNQEEFSNYEPYEDGIAPTTKLVVPPVVDHVKEDIPANPLLPKMLYPEWRQPPSCPLKDIQFV